MPGTASGGARLLRLTDVRHGLIGGARLLVLADIWHGLIGCGQLLVVVGPGAASSARLLVERAGAAGPGRAALPSSGRLGRALRRQWPSRKRWDVGFPGPR